MKSRRKPQNVVIAAIPHGNKFGNSRKNGIFNQEYLFAGRFNEHKRLDKKHIT